MKSNTFYTDYFENGRSRHLDLGRDPSDQLKLIVVIPSYNEEKLIEAVDALCHKTNVPPQCVEVIIIENYSELSDPTIQQIALSNQKLIENWKMENRTWADQVFHIIYPTEPKHAGVGLARKIGMDTAALRFMRVQQPQGIILNYDADCTCDPMLLDRVMDYFDINDNVVAASLYFEHPYDQLIEGPHRESIVNYELHLRVFIEWQRFLRLPYAYHTVGSSMAARAGAYTRKGGMNKRKAGEDFYFIHKFTDGDFGEINNTVVIPSCRSSDRVPFGTGRAIQESLSNQKKVQTYNPSSFLLLSTLLGNLNLIYQNEFEWTSMDSIFYEFFRQQEVHNKIEEFQNNTRNYASFEKRFYQWFDAFLLMKYLHYMRDHGQDNVPCLESTNSLLEKKGMNIVNTAEEGLTCLRVLQKNQ